MRWVVALLAITGGLESCVIVPDAPFSRRAAVTSASRPRGFTSRQREIVHAYFAETHRPPGCPPGLAKKRNGCLPPGQAKKRYMVGRPLQAGVAVLPLPRELAIRIGMPAPGYRYGVVDGDVVKVAVGTLLIVDAIVGLSS